MTKSIFLLACLWFVSLTTFSKPNIDSLELRVKNRSSATWSDDMWQLGLWCIKKDTARCRVLAHDLLHTSRENNDLEGQSRGYHLLAEYYKKRHDFGKFITTSYRALESVCAEDFESCLRIKNSVAGLMESIDRPEEALQYRFQLVRYYQQQKNIKRQKRQYQKIAGDYYKLNKADSALYYHRMAIALSKKQTGDGGLASAYNSLALIFQKENQLDSAEYYYRQGLAAVHRRSASRRVDTATIGFISGNIGNIYFKRGNFEEAKKWMRIDIRFSTAGKNRNSEMWARLGMADLYLREGKVDSAIHMLSKTNQMRNSAQGAKQKMRKYELQSVASMRKGDFKQSEYFLSQYVALVDSLSKEREEKVRTVEVAQTKAFMEKELSIQKLENEKNQIQIEALEQEGQLVLYQRSVIVISAGTVLLLLILVFWRYRSNQKKKSEQQEMQNRLMRSEIENKRLEEMRLHEEIAGKNSQLTRMALDISRRHEFTEELMNRLKSIRKKASEGMVEEVNELMVFARNELNIDESLFELQQNISKLNFEFFDKLRQKYPKLSKSEVQLCGLIRLNLSNKEIAIIKGVSPESTKVAKSRLRKKMGLEDMNELGEFLGSI